jgi:hypothetical protein
VFDPDEAWKGDFAQAVGLPCNVTIVNNKVGDKVYDNVATISAMRPRDAEKCPELVNKATVFDLDNPDLEVFNRFPKWIQEKIQGNLNFKGSKLEKLLGGKKEEKAPEREDPPFDPDELEDNTPY